MEHQEPVAIYYVNSPTKAELIRSMLQGEGIPCEISGELQGGYAGVLEIQILTRAEDAERALSIIREQEEHQTDLQDEADEADEA